MYIYSLNKYKGEKIRASTSVVLWYAAFVALGLAYLLF